MRFRNWLYDKGWKQTNVFEPVTIAVGNLSFGGTGKTPVIEYLIRMLSDDFATVTLSRGYGRKTKGFLEAQTYLTAQELGDEPYQFYRKYGDKVKVVVGEDRSAAIKQVLGKHPETALFLLDDAFQHRRVQRDFNIMLSDYGAPFYKDFVLPTGNLREPKSGAERADCVLITKCPYALTKEEKEMIKARVDKYAGGVPVYFSRIKYGTLTPVFELKQAYGKAVLITGIAKPQVFENYVKESFAVVEHFNFSDHHEFSEDDLNSILELMEDDNISLITTEKDMVRLLPFSGHDLFSQYPLFYIPIEIEIDEAAEFEKQVRNITESIKK